MLTEEFRLPLMLGNLPPFLPPPPLLTICSNTSLVANAQAEGAVGKCCDASLASARR